MILYEIMSYIHDFFPAEEPKYGTYEVKEGSIDLPFLENGQYYIIEGSIFNDGVHQYPNSELDDETFTGYVTALKPPKSLLKLCDEIEEWREKYENVDSQAMSPFQSESFGGYSYSKQTGSGGGNISWKDAFKSQLSGWRKI